MKLPEYLHPILSSQEANEFEQDFFDGNESLEWKAMNQAGASIAKQTSLDIQESLGEKSIARIF